MTKTFRRPFISRTTTFSMSNVYGPHLEQCFSPTHGLLYPAGVAAISGRLMAPLPQRLVNGAPPCRNEDALTATEKVWTDRTPPLPVRWHPPRETVPRVARPLIHT